MFLKIFEFRLDKLYENMLYYKKYLLDNRKKVILVPLTEKQKAQLAVVAVRQKAERDYRRQVEAELALLSPCKQCANCVNDCKQDCRVLSVSCLKKRVKK